MGDEYRVVILEDEEHNRVQLVSLVESRDDLHLARILEHGRGASDICKAELPDILLADIHIPYVSGLKVARDAAALGICCVFTTKTEDFALEAFRMGAVGYVTKPFNPEEFHNTIDQAIRYIRGRKTNQTAARPLPRLAGALTDQYGLTPAEVELTMAVMSGYIRENLPSALSKSERAVKSLLQGIYRKTVDRDNPYGGTGRSDKYGRLIYFLHELERLL